MVCSCLEKGGKTKSKKAKGGGKTVSKPQDPLQSQDLGFSSCAGVPPLRQAPASTASAPFLAFLILVSLFQLPTSLGPQHAHSVPTGSALPSVLTCFWTGSGPLPGLVTSGRMLRGQPLTGLVGFYHPPGVVLGTEGQVSWPCSEPAGQL